MNHCKHLNWLLMAVPYPHAPFGVVADAVTAQATVSYLRERAFAFARRKRFFDPDLADEALCAMLAWVPTSRLCERFNPDRGTPRQFIERVLSNFVAWEIRKRCRRVAGPLHDGLRSRETDPAKTAEIRELTVVCQEFIATQNNQGAGEDDDDAAGSPVLSPNKPKAPDSQQKLVTSTIYVRRHRERKRMWLQLQPHFPELKAPLPRRRQRTPQTV